MSTDNPDETEFTIDADELEEESEKRESKVTEMNDHQQREKEAIANKNTTTAILLGVFLTPAAYAYVGKWGLAALNFITFNYFLTGFVVVPWHTRKMIREANQDLREANVKGY